MALNHMKGLDATDAITAFHPSYVIEKRMKAFKVGELPIEEQKSSKVSEAWHKLHAQLTKEKLFETDFSFWMMQVVKLAGNLEKQIIYFILRHILNCCILDCICRGLCMDVNGGCIDNGFILASSCIYGP